MSENNHDNQQTHLSTSSASGVTNQNSGGVSIPAPPAQNGLIDGIIDGIGDITNTRPNEAQLDRQEDAAEKAAFLGQNYGPITYTRPNISGSGFEASYFPSQQQLYAEVRAKLRFADGLVNTGGTISSPNAFMNRGQIINLLNLYPALAAQVLPFYQWGGDERQIHLQRFQDNIGATMGLWQNTGMSFQVDRTGWEDVTATPRININVTEGTATTVRENYGPLGLLSRVNEGASDHLQVEIVKQISRTDANTVNGIITSFLANQLPGNGLFNSTLRNALQPAAGDARGVRSYLGNDRGGGRGASEGHNNFMSLESDRSDNSQSTEHVHSVLFDHDSASIAGAEEGSLDAFLADPSVLLQNPNGTVTVRLHGHASPAGTTEYNTELTQHRLDAVTAKVNSAISSSSINIQQAIAPANQVNHADINSESDLASDPSAHDEAAWRRVTLRIRHSGRNGQNVVAHEFGHVFGLGDEYVEVANGYNRPATATNPTSLGDHDQLAKDAGVATGAPVANDSRILSTGNDVQAEHYSTFADALRQLTNVPWKINTPTP